MRLNEVVIQYHKELNPKLWEKGGILKDDVYVALVNLSQAFIKFLEIDTSYIEQVVLTGSNCNYNWKSGSDLDIHVVINYPEFQKTCSTVDIEEMFLTKKNLWNSEHDIEINGIPTEMYVQNSAQNLPKDDSLFSLTKNEWITPPKKLDVVPDDEAIKAIVTPIKKVIKDLIASKTKNLDQIKALQDKIKSMRQSGLAKEGQFSSQNLAFKKLRDDGDIESLWDYYAKVENDNLSLKEMATAQLPWVKPNIPDEMSEFDRTADELHLPLNDLLLAAGKGRLIPLNDDIWSKLENTDSFELKTGDREALNNPDVTYGRDVSSIISGIRGNQSIPAPIVLKQKDNYYLIAGNTRLCTAKVLGKTPMIYLITLDALGEMAAAEVNQTEHAVDELFREIGLDVIFSNHFKERITPGNEDSRDVNVTPEEVIRAFKAMRLQYGKQLLRAKFDKVAFEGLLKDMSTKINIPFVIDYDKAYSGYHQLVAKTLMRKSDFRNDNFNSKVLQVRS